MSKSGKTSRKSWFPVSSSCNIFKQWRKRKNWGLELGHAQFSKNLYSLLSAEPSNIFFSPISIHAILSLMYQGAQGHTYDAFTTALKLPDSKVAATGYKTIMSELNSIPDVTLLMANKIFLQETYKLHKAFKAVAAQKFLSEVKQLNFKQPQGAATTINTWVMEKTKNKIKEAISPDDLTDRTVLILVNAIYFKGKWAYPFKVQDTITENFYLDDVNCVPVQMMHIRRRFFYKDDAQLHAQVLELPYVNKNISMIVVLPKNISGIKELELNLANYDITKLGEDMRDMEVALALPRFKIEQTIDLEGPLTELGLGVIFTEDGEFPGIVDSLEPMYVSRALQKTFLEVNEEGTEAAAATGVQSTLTCGVMWLRFTANHPFIIILQARQENVTNVLFMGRLYEPKE